MASRRYLNDAIKRSLLERMERKRKSSLSPSSGPKFIENENSFKDFHRSYLWIFYDFLQCEMRNRETYRSPTVIFAGAVWHLAMSLRGEPNNEEFVISVIKGQSPEGSNKKIKWKLSFMYKNGNKQQLKEGVIHSNQPRFYEILNSKRNSFLQEEYKDLLPDKRLTICFELTVLNDFPLLQKFREDERNELREIQSCHKDLSATLSKLLQNEEYSDFVLNIGEKQIKVHKCILGSRSSVFAAMFSHDTEENKTNSVTITDMDFTTTVTLIKYIYTGELPEISLEEIVNLYGAADKYAVLNLKKRCSKRLLSNVTDTNYGALLLLADKHSDDEMKSSVIEYIIFHEGILIHENWKSFCMEHKKLSLDILNEFATRSILAPLGPPTPPEDKNGTPMEISGPDTSA